MLYMVVFAVLRGFADFGPLCRLSAISFVIYFFENVGCGKF